MRIGLLTGGGDCPGLNAAIRAVVRHSLDEVGATVYGFRDGWRGVMEGTADELTRDEVRGILPRGGTILGTSGVQPFRTPDGIDRVRETTEVHRLDGYIAIGGEGTMSACAAMPDVPVIGVPKTIDNDIGGTDHSIGFQTAVQIATDLIDRLYSTAESHQRVMVCEVMGRSAGWIGLEAGIAGAADVILLPEHPFDIELVARRVKQRMLEDRRFSIVVVSEGAVPLPGTMDVPEYPLDENGWPRLGGMGSLVARELGDATASNPASRSWGTCSVAGRRSPTIGCSPPGSGSRPSRKPRAAVGGTWWAWSGGRSRPRRSPRWVPPHAPCPMSSGASPRSCASDDRGPTRRGPLS